jgi:hypothetical protein
MERGDLVEVLSRAQDGDIPKHVTVVGRPRCKNTCIYEFLVTWRGELWKGGIPQEMRLEILRPHVAVVAGTKPRFRPFCLKNNE